MVICLGGPCVCVCVRAPGAVAVWFWTVTLLYSKDDHTTAREGARWSHMVDPECLRCVAGRLRLI